MNTDHVTEIRRALNDPRALCDKLGLLKDSKRQSRGVLICCPVHGDRSPSCSVTRAEDGNLRVKCFACDFAGDALRLVSVVYRIDDRGDQFKDLLRTAAELAGLHWIVDELSGSGAKPLERPAPLPEPVPLAPPEYPDMLELVELWETSVSVADDAKASGAIVARRADPDVVAKRSLARAITRETKLPIWAKYQGNPWTYTGHTLLLPMYDCKGAFRSVRAWRTKDGESPKRLPPAGRKASELVLANTAALAVLRGTERKPQRVVFVEGEPDFLVTATITEVPVIGIVSGSWTNDFAKRIPNGTDIYLMTHADDAGERYAKAIAESLDRRCVVWRKDP